MEQVVLLDERGQVSGTASKTVVHHECTPLHLAFSCYVFNDRDELLVTRRADSKKTWPGVWTNSCCGHPRLGEDLTLAVRRRLQQELEVTAAEVTLILPAFRYVARMSNGVLENEMCPVFRAYTDGEPTPDPSEVSEVRWVDWESFSEQVRSGDRRVSPWCALQIAELSGFGPRPKQWPHGDPGALPAACPVTED